MCHKMQNDVQHTLARLINLPRPVRLLVVGLWMGVIWLASERGAKAIQSDAASAVRSAPRQVLELAAVGGHVVEFGMLGALLAWALPEPLHNRWLRRVLAWALTSGYGVVDEWHQSWVPGRVPSLFDVAVDSSSGLVGVVASEIITGAFGAA